jgi:hypothetical protein
MAERKTQQISVASKTLGRQQVVKLKELSLRLFLE